MADFNNLLSPTQVVRVNESSFRNAWDARTNIPCWPDRASARREVFQEDPEFRPNLLLGAGIAIGFSAAVWALIFLLIF